MRGPALPYVLLAGLLALAGCDQGYSPNTYASTAAQQAAPVERGVIIGVRQVRISASGTIGAAAGGAAGGVAGSQVSGGPVVTTLGAISGTLVGGIGGTAAAQAVADTKGWEYIVDETGEKLVSVTQTSKAPLALGQHVLVISGAQQARIVPDYTVEIAAAPAPAPAKTASDGPANTEINIGPVPPAAEPAAPVVPFNVANDPPASGPGPNASTAAPPSAPNATAKPATPAAGTVRIAPGVSIALPPPGRAGATP